MTRWQALAATALRAAVRTGTRQALRALNRGAGGSARTPPRTHPSASGSRGSGPSRGPAAQSPRASTEAAPHAERRAYPGDFTGVGHLEYAPDLDGEPDPGEIVWTWVPFEEDATRGKDRPVLVIGHHDDWMLALILSSRDHDGPGSDAADEARHGRTWMEIGSGSWDRRGRTSEVRLDRVVRVDPAAVRREGAVLERDRFEAVARRLRADHGWS